MFLPNLKKNRVLLHLYQIFLKIGILLQVYWIFLGKFNIFLVGVCVRTIDFKKFHTFLPIFQNIRKTLKSISKYIKFQSILMNMLSELMQDENNFNDAWMNKECYVKKNNNNSMQ